MAFEFKKIAQLGEARSAPVNQRPGFKLPLAQDRYIGPEELHPKLTTPRQSARPPRSLFFGGLFQRGKILREAGSIVAKLSLLPKAPDNQKIRFFEHDLPQLQKLHAWEPQRIQKLLRQTFESTPNRTAAEPWFHLALIALGDNEAFLRELERLG